MKGTKTLELIASSPYEEWRVWFLGSMDASVACDVVSLRTSKEAGQESFNQEISCKP